MYACDGCTQFTLKLLCDLCLGFDGQDLIEYWRGIRGIIGKNEELESSLFVPLLSPGRPRTKGTTAELLFMGQHVQDEVGGHRSCKPA
ncbi:hypothetical protein chiPu_0002242 [Chiloscyllium punctatum]|uniref:Uncharacterized protein n=1 Tax=Chiloscyllium punctatum TaxID=137246 RepID=A0A401S0B2_CHIPU|nr:hypothetical protein [Chiloscyllium punctatum]